MATTTPAGADHLHLHVHCSELSGPRPNISSYSSQCASTADVTVSDAAVNNLRPTH